MMKKTGAGILSFALGVFILGGTVSAQEVAAIPVVEETTADVSAPEKTPEYISPQEKASARLAEIQDLPIDELKEKLAATEAALPALNQRLGDLVRVTQETRETAAANSAEIKELYLQIRALHERIAALTETLPEVKEKAAEQALARSELLGEMDFRTRLTGLIRQKESEEAAKASAEELP